MAFDGEKKQSKKDFILTRGLGLSAAEVAALANTNGYSCTTGEVHTARSNARKEPETEAMKASLVKYVLSQPEAIEAEQLASNASRIGYVDVTAARVRAIRKRGATLDLRYHPGKETRKPREGTVTAFVLAQSELLSNSEVASMAADAGYECSPKQAGGIRWRAKMAEAAEAGKEQARRESVPPPAPPEVAPELPTFLADTKAELLAAMRTAGECAPTPPAPPEPMAQFFQLLGRIGTVRAREAIDAYEAAQMERIARMV